MTKILYNLLFNLFVLLASTSIIVYSLVYTTVNPQTYLKPLQKDEIFTLFSQELENSKIAETTSSENKVLPLVGQSIFASLTSGEWIGEVFEKNVIQITDYIKGDEPSVQIYLPAKQMEEASVGQIDAEVKKMVETKYVRPCSPSEEKYLKENGYDLNTKDFCLPQSIIDSKESFSQFFGYDIEDDSDKLNFFNSLIRNIPIDTTKNEFSTSQIESLFSTKLDFVKYLDWVKSKRKMVIDYNPVVISVLASILLLTVILGKLIGRKYTAILRRLSWHTATAILGTCGSTILFVWVLLQLNSAAVHLAFHGLVSGSFAQTASNVIISFLFGLVEPAIIIAVLLIIFAFVLLFMEKFIFKNIKEENEKITNYKPEPEKTKTFDSTFKTSVPQKYTSIFDNNEELKQNYDEPLQTLPDEEVIDTIPEGYEVKRYDESLSFESQPDVDIQDYDSAEGEIYEDVVDNEKK